MTPDDQRIDDLAESISDGRAPAWSEDELSASPSLRALRDVSRIAEFNRGLQRSAPTSGSSRTTSEPGRWGGLLLLEPAGAGANGEVWRAWDPSLQREVALKLLAAAPGEGGAPLLEEARALARVRHPNVVAVHGIGDEGGRTGLWMEFLAGPTLAAEIERRGPLPADQVERLGRDLAQALQAVHAAGLVHRDVKPANVILEHSGRTVLTDFGLGQRRVLSESEPVRMSGTPLFMSPERLRGQAATPRSDVYALGVTLWCALAGRLPFGSTTIGDLRREADAGPARALRAERPDAPEVLVRAIERAMHPDPAQRPASAAEFVALLDAKPMASAVRPQTHLWAMAAGLVLVLALGWLAVRNLGPRVPSPAKAPVVATPAAPATYDVEATLVKRGTGGWVRLADGDRVTPGDQLSLEFRATRRTWVYVLNEDERGESYLLFPQPRFDVANPISPDAASVLPGTIGGAENAWTVTSRGGREHFLIVASPEPVAELEAELGRIPPAAPDRPIEYAPVSAPTMERLRGVGGVATVRSDDRPRRAGTFDRFEALAGREQGVQGVWVRRVTLENPVR